MKDIKIEIDGYAGTMTFKAATSDLNDKLIFEDLK